MSARPGQPVDDTGRPITAGYTEIPDTLPAKDDDVIGHGMPDTDQEPGPKLILAMPDTDQEPAPKLAY